MITLNALIGQVSDGMDIVWPLPGADGWASIGAALQAIHAAGMARPAARSATAAAPAGTAPADSAPASCEGAEGVTAVICGDAPSVRLERFPTLGLGGHAALGLFRPLDLLSGVPCASWAIPAADPYAGPWNAPLSAAPPDREHDP